MKVAYIPMRAAGHILASLPMVAELVKKGVEVNYFAPEQFRGQVEASGSPRQILEASGNYLSKVMNRKRPNMA